MEAAAKKQEQERLEAEEQARKEAELKKIEEKLEKEKIAALLQQAGEKQVDLEKLAAKHLDQAALQRAVQEKLLKAKEEETRRRAEQARKVDYLVRALREAESTKVQALLQATLASEKAYVEEYNTSNLNKKRSTFETAMAVKGKITRMVPAAEAFEERIMKRRREQYLQKKVRKDEIAHSTDGVLLLLLLLSVFCLPQSSRCALIPAGVPIYWRPRFNGRRRPQEAHSDRFSVLLRGKDAVGEFDSLFSGPLPLQGQTFSSDG